MKFSDEDFTFTLPRGSIKIAPDPFTQNLQYAVLTSYLFFEVTYRVLVGVSEKIQNRMFDVIVLEVVHEMRSIALKNNQRSLS